MPVKIIFSQEQVSLIVSQYNDGMGLRTIGRDLGYSAQTIEKCLLENGISIRPMNQTIGKELEIASLYESGETFLSIAKRYKTDRKKIKTIVLQSGVTKRSHAEQQRRYHLKEDFFDSIDSEEKAYFLGLMYADGCNDKSGRKFTLGLQLKDKPILDAFRRCLEYEGPLIYDVSNANVCILAISSVKMSARLTALGCTPVKSLTLTFPEWMPEYLLHHFIRGYFDGDGWVTGVFRRVDQPSIGILGTDSFVKAFASVITQRVGVRVVIRGHGVSRGISRAIVSGAIKCGKLADYLYQDASVYLSRKKERADLIIPIGKTSGEKNKMALLTNKIAEEIRNDRRLGLKRTELVEKYKVSYSTIDRVIYDTRYFT